jgi:hypothetical protein
MHAIAVRVNIHDFDTAVTSLREHIVPRVKQAPGFVAGYWTRKDDQGMALLVFESEEAAEGAVEPVRAGATEGVTLESVEVREVVEHA